MSSNPPSTFDLINAFWVRRRLWATVTAASALLFVVVALVLPVYYRASTTFLAASPDQTNPTKLLGSADVEVYGTGNDLERLIAIANSEAVVSQLIDSFDLYTVYDIDPEGREARFRVREELSKLYEVERTRYDEVSISIEDRDPERAASMANAAREQVRGVVLGLLRSGQMEAADKFRGSIAAKTGRRLAINDSLRQYAMRYNIIDVDAQSEALSQSLAKAEGLLVVDSARLERLQTQRRTRAVLDTLQKLESRLAGNRAARAALRRQVRTFSSKAAQVASFQTELEILSEQLAYNLEQLRQQEAFSAGRAGTVMFLIDAAEVPQRKSRPIRWLIVVAGTAAVGLFTALGIVLSAAYRQMPWTELG